MASSFDLPAAAFGLITVFFVLIGLLRELHTPDQLSRLQALGADLLLRGALVSSDPSDPELVASPDDEAQISGWKAVNQLMAKVIEFYIPNHFQKKVAWVPRQERGK